MLKLRFVSVCAFLYHRGFVDGGCADVEGYVSRLTSKPSQMHEFKPAVLSRELSLANGSDRKPAVT
jgi:hypothetical protein